MYLRWKNTNGKLLTVQFDVVNRENVEGGLTITTHPVEDGADITDHAHETPDKITVEGYISNKPLPSNPGVFADSGSGSLVKASSLEFKSVPLKMNRPKPIPTFGEEPPSIFDSIKAGVSRVSPGGLTKLAVGAIEGLFHKTPDHAMVFAAVDGWEDRAKRVYELLDAAKAQRARFEVGIKMVTLRDMLISKLGVPRTAKDGGGATFNIDFQRVRIVNSATVAAPVPAEARGAVEKPAGQKPPEEDGDDKKNKKSVILQAGIFTGVQRADRL